MAADPNPALRAELVAALEEVQEDVRGLQDLTQPYRSQALMSQAAQTLAEKQAIAAEISAVLAHLDGAWDGMNRLESNHGYPDFPHVPLSQELFDELQKEVTDFQSAANVFVVDARATHFAVTEDVVDVD
jgi:hypothetical protein